MNQRRLPIVALVAALSGIANADAAWALDSWPGDRSRGETRVETRAIPTDTLPDPDALPRLLQDERFTLDIGARVQVRYTHVFPEEGDSRGSFRVRRARLNLAGQAYDHFDYRIQFELAGSGARLLDATIAHTFRPEATLTLGQAKAPFGRQQLTSSSRLQFVDRSIVDGRFAAGRQVGARLSGRLGDDRLEYGVGVYNGEGVNRINDEAGFMQVARFVWTPLGPYPPAESSLDYPDASRVALGVAALNTTLEGGDAEGEVGVRRFNVEAAYKLRGFNATGELYVERRDPEQGGDRRALGWLSQVAYLLPDRTHELALRYGAIDPEVEGPDDGDRTEIAVGVSRYLEGHNAKIQADVVRVDDALLDAESTELRLQLQVAF